MSAGSDHQRIDWSGVPTVFVDVPTCAHCGWLEFDTQRSLANGDGSRTKLAICRGCHQPFKISLEVPGFGNVIWPDQIMGPEDFDL